MSVEVVLWLCVLLVSVPHVRRPFLRARSLPLGDRPGGSQRALTFPVAVPSSRGCPGFAVDLPCPASLVGPEPTRYASTTMLSCVLGGRRLGMLMVEVLDPDSGDPQVALDAARRTWSRRGILVGPSQVSTFAGRPAVSMDVRLHLGKVEREWRFLKDGAMFSVGLVCHIRDEATLDTGAAVLASWRWSDDVEGDAAAESS